eukprot:COSAG05_NODE_1865_length_3934_cov_6.136375_5_plen_191_part_00
MCWEFSVVQGQDVVQQGSPGTDSLFVVASGTLVAYKIDAACLCNYERGQYFGERVMLAKNDRQARGASVRATTADTTVVQVCNALVCLPRPSQLPGPLAYLQIWRKDLVKLPIVINRLRELLKISKSSGSSLDRKIVKRYLNSGMVCQCMRQSTGYAGVTLTAYRLCRARLYSSLTKTDCAFVICSNRSM